MKTILIIIMAAMLAASALGYTIVDYDDFSYSASGSALSGYGWRAASTGVNADSLDYCSVSAGTFYCSNTAGVNKYVGHLFNNVTGKYCLNSNNGFPAPHPSNFSIRLMVRVDSVSKPYEAGRAMQFGYPALEYNSTYIQYNTPAVARLIPNYTGYASSYNWFWYSVPSGQQRIYKSNFDNWDIVQLDFVSANDSSPPPNFVFTSAIITINGNASSYAVTSSHSDCLNATSLMFNPNTQFEIDNYTVIHYADNEPFLAWNTSIIITSPTYNCSDSIDNDGDSFIDYPADESCTSPSDTTEHPYSAAQCYNGIDDDGDLLVDYPDDTGCLNITDNDESPASIYQCNDNADNDGDGLIDYPDDPRCVNYSDNSEAPADASTQPEDSCSTADNCLFKETFPYTDSVYFHDWTELDPLSGYALNVPFMSGRAMQLVNFIPYNLNTTKDFANNPTLYSTVDGTINMYFPTIAEDASFYVVFDNPTAISFKIKVVINNSAQAVSFYSVDEYNNEYFAYTQYKALSVGSYIPLDLSINNAFGTYTLSDGITEYSYNMWYNLSYTRIRFEASGAQMDGDTNLIYVTDILFNGQPLGSTCTPFEPPYYLKEQFISGLMADCGWTVTPVGTSVSNGLTIDSALPSFNAYKQMYDASSGRYTTLSSQYIAAEFDFFIEVGNSNTNVLSFSIWDSSNNKFLTIIIDKNAAGKGFSPDVSGNYFDTVIGTWHTCKIIIDLNSDIFSLYIDGSAEQTAIGFDSDTLNVRDVAFVMLESSFSAYRMNNIEVYLTDSAGEPLPQTQVTPVPNVDNGTTLFGLIFKSNPSCVVDSDCLSGKCGIISKKCDTFNWRACDESGYNRNFWCVFKLVFRGTLGWIGDLIMDNFLSFIIILILLMIAVYFAIMFRKGG